MICVRLRPRVRRVSSRTLVLKRATACGAMRRRGASFPPVKLKPRNLRTLGLATALLALFTFSLRRLARSFSMPAIARPLAADIDIAVIGVAYEAVAAFLQLLVQHVQHQIRQQRRERAALRRALLRRADKAALHDTRAHECTDELQDALVSNPSPPSGWIEDFHLQAVVQYSAHQKKSPARAAGLFIGAEAARYFTEATFPNW